MQNPEYLEVEIFLNIYLCIRVLVILYNELLHKYEFCQAHCVELTKRSPTKFSLQFLGILQFSMNSRSLLLFLGLNKLENKFLICAQCRPRSGLGLRPMGMVVCHVWMTDKLVGPQFGGAVQPRKWPATLEWGARAGRTRGVVTSQSSRV
jgi:hypothetical protein